jgi:Uma2 family endonuclease
MAQLRLQMDTFNPTQPSARTTQAAEGLPRWRWTTDELVRLTGLGVFSEKDKFELFGGEMVPMSPVGRHHFSVVEALQKRLENAHRPDVKLLVDRQFNFDDATFAEPDLVLWQGSGTSYDARGPDTLLVIEVADSSLQTELGFKRKLYASFGVREYWAIHAWELPTRVHTHPIDGDYTSGFDTVVTDLLTPMLVPDLARRLADLDIGP